MTTYLRTDLPGHHVIDLRDSCGSAGGGVPVGFHGTLIEGSRWARLFGQVGTLLAPVGRLVDRLVVVAVFGGGAVAGLALLTGNAPMVGLSNTVTGYRPVHLIVAGIAVLLLAVITADVVSFGRRNKAATARAARDARLRRRTDDGRDGGLCLPDNPDLDAPNGFTGPGTTAPGAPHPDTLTAFTPRDLA